MKKGLAFIVVACLFVTSATAQSMGSTYKTALGIKVWDGAGISFKNFVSGNNAVEVIGYFWKRGSRLTGLYEIHGNIAGARGLKWYVGPGAHLSFYDRKYGDRVAAGIDGVLGLDLKVNRAPINFSLDWQPSFEFADENTFIGNWGGFAIRYTF